MGDRTMERTVYCRGGFMSAHEAQISIFDRGFLFGDAIYEVTAVIDGQLIDNDQHIERLQRSLAALNIPMPAPCVEVERIQTELVARNAVQEGTVYLQISRGATERDFLYPDGMEPTFIAFTQARSLVDTPAQRNGIAVDLAPDPRWARCDIKTSMLLGQVLAKREARAGGFNDVWLVKDGLITEGASSTAFIITDDGCICTRPNSQVVLPGCTRTAVQRLCHSHDLQLEEQAFSPTKAQAAVEAFLTSASSLITPVVRIGDTVIGDGRPGPITRRLQASYPGN